MTVQRSVQFGFSGGVISPEAQGRFDIDKYQLGLEVGKNFLLSPLGVAMNRPGFESVQVYNSGNYDYGRVIPFHRPDDDDIPLVFVGDNCFLKAAPFTASATASCTIPVAGTVTKLSYAGAYPDFSARIYEGAYIKLTAYIASGGNIGEYLTGLSEYYRVQNLDTTAKTFYLTHYHGGSVDTSQFTHSLTEQLLFTFDVSFEHGLTDAQLANLRFSQSGNDMFFVAPDGDVRRLRCATNGALGSFFFETVDFSRDYRDFTVRNVSAVPTGVGSEEYEYLVAPVSADGIEGDAATVDNTVASVNITSFGYIGVYLSTYLRVIFSADPTLSGIYSGSHIRLAGTVGAPELEGKTFVALSAGYFGLSLPNTNMFLFQTSWAVPYYAGGYTAGGSASLDKITNDLSIAGNKNTLEWDQTPNAERYIVYKKSRTSGVFGYIGGTDGLSFVDDNIIPDESVTPPKRQNPFQGPGNNPCAVAGHDRRITFGGTQNGPQHLWATGINEQESFLAAFPPNADDAFSLRAAAMSGRVRHLVSHGHLIAFTSREEVAYLTPNGEGMTPFNVVPRTQSRVGCSNARPVVAGGAVMFCAESTNRVHALARSSDYGYAATDLCVLTPHFFADRKVVDMAYTEIPFPVVWCVTDDGKLLSLTFLPEQKVAAWSEHETTNGTFLSVASIRTTDGDRLYATVHRDHGDYGETVSLEVLALREEATSADCKYLDGMVTRVPPIPAAFILGLTEFEGKEVAVLGDGAYLGTFTVAVGGQLTLSQVVTKAQIGYPYQSKLRTLPLPQEGNAFGDYMNVVRLRLKLRATRGVKVGVSEADLFEPPPFREGPYTGAPPLVSGITEVPLPGDWNQTGQVYVVQDYPLPVTLVAMQVDVARG